MRFAVRQIVFSLRPARDSHTGIDEAPSTVGKKFAMTASTTRPARYWIYILECRNGSYYTGYTSDMDRRWEEHCAGSPKSKYTRGFAPTRIVARWRIRGTRGTAMRIERLIKSLTRVRKEELVARPETLGALIRGRLGVRMRPKHEG